MSNNLVSKVVNKNSVATLQKALNLNIYAKESRLSPNANKLVDGAIQRQSVQPSRYGLAVKVNKDKVGVTRRPVQGTLSSDSGLMLSDPWTDFARY